jgi:hypothetical protein
MFAVRTVGLTGNYDVDATLDTSRISLAPVIAMYAPEQAAMSWEKRSCMRSCVAH